MHPPAAHGNSLPSYWQRVRAYAVPPSMIETATARRRAGDWAGACAAAHIDVDLRPRALARSHGRDLADRVRADLARLAPDLLRWHMPRKSTRLNSSHVKISYAVFCLKKKRDHQPP